MPTPAILSLPVESGNAGSVTTHGTGWFIGYSDWCKLPPHDLRHMPQGLAAMGLCVKWFAHAAGDPWGQDKPLSTGRTVSVLVSEHSRFQLDFSADPAFAPTGTITHWLRRAGDYVIWGAGVYHRAFGHEAATMLTLRWEPATAV